MDRGGARRLTRAVVSLTAFATLAGSGLGVAVPAAAQDVTPAATPATEPTATTTTIPRRTQDDVRVLQRRAEENAVRLVAAARAIRHADASIDRLHARLRVLRREQHDIRRLLRDRAIQLYVGLPVSDLVVAESLEVGSGALGAARLTELVSASQRNDERVLEALRDNRADIERASDAAAHLAARRRRAFTKLRRVQVDLDALTTAFAVDSRQGRIDAAISAWLRSVAASSAPGADAGPGNPSAEPLPGIQAVGPPPATETQAETGAHLAALYVPIEDLACPVKGPFAFTNDWGNPRSGFRFHLGNDLFAARGTKLVAVANGVARQTFNRKGGSSVWLDADHGVSYYYAHLDRYEGEFPGGERRVRKGQVLGYVGNSGNAAGGPTHVHFQVHPGGAGAVNPYSIVLFACTAGD